LKTMLLYCVSRVVRKLWPIQSLVSPFYSTGPDETFCRYRLCCCWLFAHLLHLVGCLVALISAHSTCYCSLLRNAFRMFGQWTHVFSPGILSRTRQIQRKDNDKTGVQRAKFHSDFLQSRSWRLWAELINTASRRERKKTVHWVLVSQGLFKQPCPSEITFKPKREGGGVS
jgi:hypothetical protein